MHERLEDTLRRLKEERDEADRRYNEALTALDRALVRAPAVPQPPPPYDEHQLPALNQSWNVLSQPPGAAGLRGRFRRAVWAIVAPSPQRTTSCAPRSASRSRRRSRRNVSWNGSSPARGRQTWPRRGAQPGASAPRTLTPTNRRSPRRWTRTSTSASKINSAAPRRR